ncbi:MAG TPA: hypothetical protein PKW08_08830 [Flavobacteriaceae bacterium]|nr:hypothetical protein [Flavobacteriaceae bacterium]MCB9213807.1 hypothetical protein [Alteromonas sp.]HPF11203.1 hypothetical protein [Flavobacteriaceae bacterium]HQU21682.1 hypothetical protein [Flavobacteriaceae bacterium]HQU64578.1 hypothetical protein [Flavobacteriaceae bacterium]
MNKNLKYLVYLCLAVIGIGTLPNLILRPIWSSGTATLTILLNSFIIPISLLLVTKWINEKFEKDWWILKYALIIGAVCLSVYLGFLNWAHWADKTPVGWGSENVDKGTYMILNLELMVGLGIIGFALLIKIITKITNRTKKPTANNA